MSDRVPGNPSVLRMSATVVGSLVGMLCILVNIGILLWTSRSKPDPTEWDPAAAATRLAQLREQERTELTTYGFVKPDHTVARIPLDVAIDRITAGEGLPAIVPQPTTAPAGKAAVGATSSPAKPAVPKP